MSNNDTFKQHVLAFKALSNPHRLALFHRLMSCCVPGTVCNADEAARYCVGDLGKGMDIAPSTLSHHLKELKQAGLIQMQREGKTIQCWVEPNVLHTLADFFAQ
ncbi:MAG: metalloregulator ArsR/SmtB family transcription factor [Gammaproteobacteria bacterium]|nr:metalloregulator ArsR/SmtB family transcription factor [Gammaproteobacteria bacterium]